MKTISIVEEYIILKASSKLLRNSSKNNEYYSSIYSYYVVRSFRIIKIHIECLLHVLSFECIDIFNLLHVIKYDILYGRL